MSQDRELETYLQDAATWDADRIAQRERNARFGWLTAGAGWICAMLTALALVLLMPLKRVEPFVIRVDNASGVVDVVPTYTGERSASEIVTRYLLSHYVTVCERFNFATAESDYEECGAFHGAQRNQEWAASWTLSNPKSPLNVHKDGSSVRVQVQSVSFFKRASGIADLAQIRYLRAERTNANAAEHATHWIATIQYAYAAPSQDLKTRAWNPLGFKILEFRPEPEAPAQVETGGGV